MHILFLTENFPPETNAAATRVYERAVYWVRWGHRVTVLTTAPNFPQGRLLAGYRNRWYQRETIDGIEVVRVKTFITANTGILLRTVDFVSFMANAFVAGLFQKRPDVVVATSPQFFTAIGGWALAAIRRLPFIFELGDLWPRSIVAVGAMPDGILIDLLEQIELFLYRRAAAVVALTQAFKDDLTGRGIDAAKIAVVRNGVDLARYAPQPRDEALAAAHGLAGKFVIGYVGTHGLAHDLGNVLDAAERLRDQTGLVFLLVGAGADRDRLIAEARQRRIDNVVFLPMQPKDAMPGIWSLCDVALVHLKDSPAFAEVIPSKMFEAMAMGKPILLVAPAGEAMSILLEDVAGLWVEAGHPDALAAAASRLLHDDALCRDLAAHSLAAAQHHTLERQAALFIDCLTQVVRTPGTLGCRPKKSTGED
jgi:colanic acid biosynthesis glycosyl transferase WcaI